MERCNPFTINCLHTLSRPTEGEYGFLQKPSNKRLWLTLHPPFTPSQFLFFSTAYELPNLQVLCFDKDPTVPGVCTPILLGGRPGRAVSKQSPRVCGRCGSER